MSEFDEMLNEAGDDDDGLIVDFSEAAEGGGNFSRTRAPEGTYLCVVKKATVGKVKSGDSAGAPKVTFQFQVTEDPDYGQKGRVFFRHCPTKGKGAWTLRQTAEAVGQPLETGQSFKPKQSVGVGVLVTVSDDTYNGKPTNNVDKVEAATSAETL